MQNLAKHNWLFIAVLLLCSLFWLQPGQAWADGSKLVYEAKLEGEISQYMVSYLERQSILHQVLECSLLLWTEFFMEEENYLVTNQLLQ